MSFRKSTLACLFFLVTLCQTSLATADEPHDPTEIGVDEIMLIVFGWLFAVCFAICCCDSGEDF